MEVKTLKAQKGKADLHYACRLCNDLAKLNGATRDLFVVRFPNIIELQRDRYANRTLTRAIHAVLFVVDSVNSSYDTVYYTRIGYESRPIQIVVNDPIAFVQKLQST